MKLLSLILQNAQFSSIAFQAIFFIKYIASDLEICNRLSEGYASGKRSPPGSPGFNQQPQITCSKSSSWLQISRWDGLLLPWPHAPKLCHMRGHQSPTAGSGWGPSTWGGRTGEGDTLHPPLPLWACARCASRVLTGGPEGPLGPSFPVSPGGPRAPGGPGGPGGPVAPSRPWSP